MSVGQTPENLLNSLYQRFNDASNLAEIMPLVEADMLSYLHAERITVYQKSAKDRGIVSRFKSHEQMIEIRLPLSDSSIAGYAALCQKSIRIIDAYDAVALSDIYPGLKFDAHHDQKTGFHTRSLMVVPIKFGQVMLGLLQVINRTIGTAFTEEDLQHANELARIIGNKLRQEFNATNAPYELLVSQGKVPIQQLREIERNAQRQNSDVEHILIHEYKVPPRELGLSLERYYQTPYFPFDPNKRTSAFWMQKVNTQYLLRQMWVPIGGDERKAIVLLNDPTDSKRIMEIVRQLQANSYEFQVGLRRDIQRYVRGEYTLDEMDLLGDPPTTLSPEPLSENSAEIIKLVNRWIIIAHHANATELHIEQVGSEHAGVAKCRIGEGVRTLATIPPEQIGWVIRRMKRIGNLDLNNTSRPQVGRCKVKMSGNILEVGIKSFPTIWGETIILQF